MVIKGDTYTIEYFREERRIVFRGVLRLQGKEHYQEVFDFLIKTTLATEGTLNIDMSKLEFLNSAGISSLCLYAIRLRDMPGRKVIITGSNSVAWQAKSLGNLLKFTDRIQLNLT